MHIFIHLHLHYILNLHLHLHYIYIYITFTFTSFSFTYYIIYEKPRFRAAYPNRGDMQLVTRACNYQAKALANVTESPNVTE